MKHDFLLLVLCLPFGLAGCGIGAPAQPLNCPTVQVLQQASSLTRFLPGRQDAGAEITTARVTGVAGSCVLAGDGALRVSFRAGFTATDGPADHGRTVTLPYFVAETVGDEIVFKTLGTIDVPFNGNLSTAAVTSKTLVFEVPDSGSSGGAEILVGFQLSPDEAAYAAAHPGG